MKLIFRVIYLAYLPFLMLSACSPPISPYLPISSTSVMTSQPPAMSPTIAVNPTQLVGSQTPTVSQAVTESPTQLVPNSTPTVSPTVTTAPTQLVPSSTPISVTMPPNLTDVLQSIVARLSDNRSANILILVTSELHESLSPELTILEGDMRDESWHPVTSVMPVMSAKELRQSLQTIYNQKPYAGIFLIGSFPFANSWGYPIKTPEETGPADYYYMDLDGQWTDTNEDGFLDYLENGSGSRRPEIFVSRLNAHNVNLFGMSEIELIRDYFARDHAYRTGALTTQNAAIYASYAHHYYGRVDSNSRTWSESEIKSTVELFPTTYAFVFDDEAEGADNKWPTEFWLFGNDGTRSIVIAQQEFPVLMGDGYDYLSIGIHGWHQGWGGLFESKDVIPIRNSGGQLPIFIQSSSCSTGDISKENNMGSVLTMGGSLVFFGMAASAESTWEEAVFWNQSLASLPAGRAYFELQSYSISNENGPIPRNVNWILLGDPTIQMHTTLGDSRQR